MKSVEKIIDINAHIQDLECEISVDNGNAIAKISFINLGYGDITAIKFNACGYNSFGDVVPVNGNGKFFLIIQDITIHKNQYVSDLKAKLPNAAIKKLDLEECQICYADGSVLSYEGDDSFIFELEEFDNPEELRALHKLYDINATYKPKDFEQGWICTCGRFNKHDKGVCSLCGKVKSDTLKVCLEESRKKLVEDYKISEENDKAIREEERKKQEKEKTKKNIKIWTGVIIAIIFCCLIGHSITMSKRTTYESVEEMKEALEGTYTAYSDYNGEASKQIIIKNGQYRYVYKSLETDEYYIDIEFYPSKGKIHTFEDLIVTRNGDLDDGDTIFKRGGYMSMDNNSSYGNGYESGYTALDVIDLEWNNNSSYTVCTGKVKNTGNSTDYYVEVKGAFKDSSGNVLDTDWTYAVGSEGLAPGESSSFRLSVDKDSDIADCSVSILDFE